LLSFSDEQLQTLFRLAAALPVARRAQLLEDLAAAAALLGAAASIELIAEKLAHARAPGVMMETASRW
jgi:hypothetical protein